MHLIQASDESQWNVASNILKQVALDLDSRNKRLWNQQQLEEEELKKTYKLEELFFLTDSTRIIGMVFIQSCDLLFWPHVNQGESLFLHKLAVLPANRGNGFGRCIVELAVGVARRRGLSWVRLDCDVRPELTQYYEGLGFSLVDVVKVLSFEVARYQLFVIDELRNR